MPDVTLIPVIEEEARLSKRTADVERVTVRTSAEAEEIVLRGEVRWEDVEVTRVPVGREVSEAPGIRTEGDVTIVPVLEERLVVEKRLFLVEELHLRRTARLDPVEVATTVRRTRVDVERESLIGEETD